MSKPQRKTTQKKKKNTTALNKHSENITEISSVSDSSLSEVEISIVKFQR